MFKEEEEEENKKTLRTKVEAVWLLWTAIQLTKVQTLYSNLIFDDNCVATLGTAKCLCSIAFSMKEVEEHTT